MWHRLAADLLLIVHFFWIAFLILGLPLGLYFSWDRLRLLHAMGLITALVFQLYNILCPLTVWEEYFRQYQRPGFDYGGSFIMAHIEKLVYPAWISFDIIIILTALLVGATVISFVIKPPNQASLD